MHPCRIVLVHSICTPKGIGDSLHTHYNLRPPDEGSETPAFKGRKQARYPGDVCP